MVTGATSLALLQREIIGGRIHAVYQSQPPHRIFLEESECPGVAWVYFNWYVELESGILFRLDEFTIEILDSLPEPTVQAEACATRIVDGCLAQPPKLRGFHELDGTQTQATLESRQITQILVRGNQEIESRPLFLVLDHCCQLYVANKEYGNTFQLDELDLLIDLAQDEERYYSITTGAPCDALGRRRADSDIE